MSEALSANIVLPTEAIRAFCQKWGISELALFSSVLRADFNEQSDINARARVIRWPT